MAAPDSPKSPRGGGTPTACIWATGTLKVTGGGTIPVGTKKANFGFNAQKEPNGTPRGQLQFTDHSNGDKVHSETIDSLLISGNTATFEGTARRNNVPCGRFKVTVQDNKAIISSGKTSVEANVKTETADSKFSSTTVRYQNGDGKYRLQEIRLGGTNTKLVFEN